MAPNTSSSPARQHGVRGVYHGGTWLDLEDCHGVFTGVDHDCSGCAHATTTTSSCPRSQSRNVNTSSSTDQVYDVCIVGAGCVGASMARELSRYQLSILWLEAADDVSQGATKGNSGIVHAGYDDKPGTNRAKYCWTGNQLFPQLDRDLRFGYQLNGSLVVATDQGQLPILQDLLKRGHVNGVQNLRIVQKTELFEMEPHLNPNAVAALYSPDAGNVIPYEFTIALAENAVDNGVELQIRRTVTAIDTTSNKAYLTVTMDHWEPKQYIHATRQSLYRVVYVSMVSLLLIGVAYFMVTPQDFRKVVAGLLTVVTTMILLHFPSNNSRKVRKNTPLTQLVNQAKGTMESRGGATVSVDDMRVGGSGSARILQGQTVAIESIRCRRLINCAGSASDAIAKMAGDENLFRIKPRLGDYLLLHRNQGALAKHTIFPCPDPILGKGVLVQTTLWGNLILGPTARDMHQTEASNMSAADIQRYILSKCQALVPSFDAKETIHAFCGARAKSDRGDWIIEASNQDGRVIHVAGIDSPGLAGSPAIALEVVRLLEESGITLTKDPTFNPKRAPIITPKDGMRGLKLGPVGKNDSDGTDESQMAKNVICKCEKVTELEVVRALRRSLPIDSTQAIRKRTRAGMGHCQGAPDNYNCEARVKAIIARETGMPMDQIGGRPWPATSTLTQRWPDETEKQALEERMKP